MNLLKFDPCFLVDLNMCKQFQKMYLLFLVLEMHMAVMFQLHLLQAQEVTISMELNPI